MTNTLAALPPTSLATPLWVDREDIHFHSTSADRVRIAITVHNRGSATSVETPLRIEAAAFGAFLAWRPLDTLTVPPVSPGGAVRVETEVARPTVQKLGGLFDVPPRQLATAVMFGEPRPDRPNRRAREQVRRTVGSDSNRLLRPVLPPDVFDLVGRRNAHWAGNLNVFIGRRSVERHMARALRVYPGRPNHALFFVGGEANDAYSLCIEGDALDWRVRLFGENCSELGRGLWLETPAGRPQRIIMTMVPPAGCLRGEIRVQIRQRSTHKVALV